MMLLITTMIMPAPYFISWVMINDRPMGSCGRAPRKAWSESKACDVATWKVQLKQRTVVCDGIYPLVNQHNYGKSPFLIGKSTINGPFSIAM